MSTELFPLDSIQMDAPRLAWLKKHRVMTLHTPTAEHPWCAWFLRDGETRDNYGIPSEYKTGFDENDALVELAKAAGLRLWNEEGA